MIDKILEYFSDLEVREVLVDSNRSLSIVRGVQREILPSPFKKMSEWIMFLQKFSLQRGIRLDPTVPSAGGCFQGHDYRWHSIIPPMSMSGGVFCLRKHRFEEIGLDQFEICKVKLNHIEKSISANENILICGETGSGKTSLLSSILKKYCLNERVVVLETLEEMQLHSKNWIKFIERKPDLEGRGKISLSEMIKECLRIYPDRVVVGEIRDAELSVFLETMALGHRGAMATIHASNMDQLKSRMLHLLLKEGYLAEYALHMMKDLKGMIVIFMERGNIPIVRSIEIFE